MILFVLAASIIVGMILTFLGTLKRIPLMIFGGLLLTVSATLWIILAAPWPRSFFAPAAATVTWVLFAASGIAGVIVRNVKEHGD
ncbi:MAG: hypothetical protein HY566_03715 [Candidatus Kerfeldbacteria bacterium]|nr:hypothetical protein [Candidatus Kerfeldbacteria bacterium]